jgi:hypothetical protein
MKSTCRYPLPKMFLTCEERDIACFPHERILPSFSGLNTPFAKTYGAPLAKLANVTAIHLYQERRHSLLNSGQLHLINPIKNAQEIGVIPTSLETLGMDTHTRGRFLTQEVEADMA